MSLAAAALSNPTGWMAQMTWTLQKMHKRKSVLNQNHGHLELLNEDLRCRLSVADDDLEHLRFKNSALAKHVEKLEKTATHLHHTEAELCEIRTLLDKEQDRSKQREKTIRTFENVNYTLRQQNEKLTDKLNSLQAQIEKDKFNLHSMNTELQNLQYEREETQLELQHKDNVISQKNLQLKQLEESTEECLNFLKDLRLKNQELKDQLKERQEEDLCADMMRGTDGSPDLSLSFAEEMKLVATSDEESMIEELPKPESPTADSENEWCTGSQKSGTLRAGLSLLCLFILLTVLITVARGICSGNWGFLSSETLWHSVRTLIQPHCSVHYNGLPPI